MKIMPNRMDRGFFKYQEEFENKAVEVLRSGWYVLGKEVSAFEEEFASYTGAKYCVGLASGLDALWIAFRLLNIGDGDEVIVQGNTYIASVMGITINGASPVFVEPDEHFGMNPNEIEEKLQTRLRLSLLRICTVWLLKWIRLWEFAKSIISVLLKIAPSHMEHVSTAK